MVSFFRGAGPTVLAFFWPGIGVFIGLVAMGMVAAYGSPNPWAAFGGLCLGALASLMAGGLLGMLFGLPRWVKPAADGTPKEHRSFDPNDNLVQVSDWLTKIIVGITLTQFDNLGHRLYYVAPYSVLI